MGLLLLTKILTHLGPPEVYGQTLYPITFVWDACISLLKD